MVVADGCRTRDFVVCDVCLDWEISPFQILKEGVVHWTIMGGGVVHRLRPKESGGERPPET